MEVDIELSTPFVPAYVNPCPRDVWIAPWLLIENRVVVAEAVDDPIVNRFRFVSPLFAWIENLASGDDEPTDSLPVKLFVFENVLKSDRRVEEANVQVDVAYE